MTYIIIGVVVVIILFIILLATVFSNKFVFVLIKIEKANEDIEIHLEKKMEYLERTVPIIKKELKLKSFLEDIDNISEEMSRFEANDLLRKMYNTLFKTLDENEKLYKSESLLAILDDLNSNEEKIVGAIKYYNDTVVDYNSLVMSFPTNIIAFFKGYKKKEFYNNEKREIFEILNEK